MWRGETFSPFNTFKDCNLRITYLNKESRFFFRWSGVYMLTCGRIFLDFMEFTFVLVSWLYFQQLLNYFLIYFILLYKCSPWSRYELITTVVIGTDCIDSCKSNYHTITAMTVPFLLYEDKKKCRRHGIHHSCWMRRLNCET